MFPIRAGLVFRRFLIVLTAWAIGLAGGAICTPIQAETVMIGSVPSRPGKAGFSMSVQLEAVGGNGYQPVYLDFTPLRGQFKRDRYLQVVLAPRHSFGTELNFDLNVPVKLNQGDARTRVPVLVPHYYSWDQLRVELIEDGRAIETGKGHFGVNGLRARYASQKTSIGILVPRDHLRRSAENDWRLFPDVRTLVTVFGQGPISEDFKVKRLDHNRATRLAERVQPAWVQFRLIGEDAMDDRWLAYSQLDVILAPDPLLRRIESESPKEFAAIQDWVTAGGNLWLYAAGQQKSSMATTPTMAASSPNQMLPQTRIGPILNLGQINDTSDLIYESWNGVVKQSQHYSYQSQQNRMSPRRKIYNSMQAAGHPFVGSEPRTEIAKRIRIGGFGDGKVMLIDDVDPFPGSFQFWQSVSGLNTAKTLQWSQRNGIDVPLGNDNYWGWLIKAVGQPPVKSFVFLNTVFVILIGPCCYFLFRRRGRLYLLYFFAPALALMVTMGLFAYALIADGTKTQTRIRQVTWLDLDNQVAVEQSRQTYYSVFGTSGGLKFSDDVAVYPVRNSPATDRYNRRNSSRNGEINLVNGQQQLSGSFLPPRNQVQYLVTRPKVVKESISFDWTSGNGTVTNHFDYPIRKLVVRDKQQRLWMVENLGAGETQAFVSADPDAAAVLLNEDVLPTLGTVPVLRANTYYSRQQSAGMQMTRLETKLTNWKQGLPQGSFVGITELSTSDIAVEGALTVDSVGVVMGKVPQ